MEAHQKGLLVWIKAHKMQLIIAGVSITTIVGIIIGLKNKEAIMNLWASLEKSLKKAPEKLPESLNVVQTVSPVPEKVIPVRSYTSPQEAFDVSQHIRTLSGDRHHSAKKEAEAAAMGITLLPNQTLVDSYTKYAA